MKNWTLAFAIGTAVVTTAIGLEVNSASAVTITEVKATKLTISGNLLVQPGQKTQLLVGGQGSFSWTNAQVPEKVTTSQSIVFTGDPHYISGNNDRILQTPTGVLVDKLYGTFLFGKGQYTATYNISVNPSDSLSGGFEVKEVQVPEPLTILGTGVVLGALPVLKKEYAKRNKKKEENA